MKLYFHIPFELRIEDVPLADKTTLIAPPVQPVCVSTSPPLCLPTSLPPCLPASCVPVPLCLCALTQLLPKIQQLKSFFENENPRKTTCAGVCLPPCLSLLFKLLRKVFQSFQENNPRKNTCHFPASSSNS